MQHVHCNKFLGNTTRQQLPEKRNVTKIPKQQINQRQVKRFSSESDERNNQINVPQLLHSNLKSCEQWSPTVWFLPTHMHGTLSALKKDPDSSSLKVSCMRNWLEPRAKPRIEYPSLMICTRQQGLFASQNGASYNKLAPQGQLCTHARPLALDYKFGKLMSCKVMCM